MGRNEKGALRSSQHQQKTLTDKTGGYKLAASEDTAGLNNSYLTLRESDELSTFKDHKNLQ